MRTASAGLETFLNDNTAGVIRHLVTITPRTGSAAYWTDHSSDITLGGHTFLAGGTGTVPLITWGTRREMAGTSIGSLEMTLLCGTGAQFNGVRLPIAAANRAFDGAIVKVERVFGLSDVNTSLGSMHLFEGLVAEARPSSTAVELDIESGLAALNVEIPRKLFKAGCTHTLFDAGCTLVKASFTVTGTVATLSTATECRSNLTQADGYFDLGVLTFTSGVASGLSRAVRSFFNSGGALYYDRPFPTGKIPTIGDTFTVYPGCPKTLAACETKFGTDNRAHFRGFPFCPRENVVSFDTTNGIAGWVRRIGVERGALVPDPGDESSTYGRSVPVVYGKTRVRGIRVYQGDRNGELVPVVDALCEGEITGVPRYFTDNAAGDNVVEVKTGTRPTQTPWSFLPSGKDLGYPGVALVVYWQKLENGRVPDGEWEVEGLYSGTGGAGGDALPTYIFLDLFPDTSYGAGFPFDINVTAGLDGGAASSYTRYVGQAGMYLSPALTSRRQAIDVLEEICESTNAEPLWSEGTLKIIPRADTPVGTFSPVTSVRYAFDVDDLIGDGGDLVKVRLDPETETFNSCPVVFRERAPTGAATDGTLAYQDATAEDPDPVDVALREERPAPEVRLPAICLRDHALKVSRILAQRQVRTRQEVELSVGWRFCRLEPLDLVTVTDELFPYTLAPFQIREIAEDMRTNVLTITGQEWTAGVNHATAHATQSSDGATAQWEPYSTEARIHETAAGIWTPQLIPTPGGIPYFAVEWNGAVFAAVGSSTVAASSPDGVHWTSRAMAGGYLYQQLKWNGTVFCAVGQNSCATSPDGITWTPQTIPTGTYREIAWSGSLFCAVGDGGVCATSPDGVTWTSRTMPETTHPYRSVAWGNGLWCAVSGTAGGTAKCSTSPDGVTWTPRTISAHNYSDLIWTGANFCAISGDSAATSFDGISWSYHSIPSADVTRIYSLEWTGAVILAVSAGSTAPGRVLSSRDFGATWREVRVGLPTAGANGIVWSGSMLCAVGQLGGGDPSNTHAAWTSAAV